MGQPNNYGFEEEAAYLKESARRFFGDKLPVNELHALVAGDPNPESEANVPWPTELWGQMVELGWPSLLVPESCGGVGMPWVAVAALLEENGRAACPSPLLCSLQSAAVLKACGDAGTDALSELAVGRAATLACLDESASLYGHSVHLVDGKLEGSAHFVQDAEKAEKLLVLARVVTCEDEPPSSESDKVALCWVDADAQGLSFKRNAIVDLTRDQARISFSGVSAQVVLQDAAAAWQSALPALWVLASADMVGAAEWQLQTTVEYAQQRKQFERPLGFFQAVKHDLVNVMIAIDESKSLLYSAACALDWEPEKALQLAHMAKASATETAALASGRSVQCHGGIGFTWECYLHLYFKRQEHSQRLWGDAAWHRSQLAEILI
ncbi:MAG: acyl-CoA dehydrogenase family protein [Pseudomonadota bacterium]